MTQQGKSTTSFPSPCVQGRGRDGGQSAVAVFEDGAGHGGTAGPTCQMSRNLNNRQSLQPPALLSLAEQVSSYPHLHFNTVARASGKSCAWQGAQVSEIAFRLEPRIWQSHFPTALSSLLPGAKVSGAKVEPVASCMSSSDADWCIAEKRQLGLSKRSCGARGPQERATWQSTLMQVLAAAKAQVSGPFPALSCPPKRRRITAGQARADRTKALLCACGRFLAQLLMSYATVLFHFADGLVPSSAAEQEVPIRSSS